MKLRVLVGLAVGVLALPLACQVTIGDGSPADAGAPDAAVSDAGAADTLATDAATDAGAVVKTVGAEGGTVAAPEATLEVPPGALPADTPITVAPVAPPANAEPKLGQPVGQMVRFGPEGQVFTTPVKITLTVDPSKLGGRSLADVRILTAPAGTTDYTTLSTTVVDATRVSATTLHFSDFVAAIPPALAPTCTDGIKNGSETDVDCGGTCGACGDTKSCAVPGDCVSNLCTSNVCSVAVVDIAVGAQHVCVRTSAGKVKCFGNAGRLGLGDQVARENAPEFMGANLPYVDFGTGRTARQLSATGDPTCVLMDNAQVKCWGILAPGVGDENPRGTAPGQMGDALPTLNLGAGRSAKAIATGQNFACALLDTNQVKCWGDNSFGQLGQGDTLPRGYAANQMGDLLLPIDLGAGRTAKSIGASGYFACALLDNDQVKCWGRNESGALGLGDTDDRGGVPAQMGNALPAVSLGTALVPSFLAVGAFGPCAGFPNGRIKCWGLAASYGDTNLRGNEPGEMGDALPFVDLGTGRTVVGMSAGGLHKCAILDDGKTKCWGGNGAGQAGVEDQVSRGFSNPDMGDALPYTNLGTGRSARRIYASRGLISSTGTPLGYTCAILDNASVKCWGYNSYFYNGISGLVPGSQPGRMGDALVPLNLLGP
jgi:hypothetical protein